MIGFDVRVGIAGSTGFVGGAISEALSSLGRHAAGIDVPRLRLGPGETPRRLLEVWEKRERSRWLGLLTSMRDLDVLVNAAGLAAPNSSDVASLEGANGALPALVARAAASAGVTRFIHVSSAAVQGERDPLDEGKSHRPFSPYSRSKALGEELLLEEASELPVEVVIHRPTSVQGATRSITQRLVRLSGQRIVPLCGDGDSPLPVTLVENVAAAIVFLTTAGDPPPITLQPWEGMTARSLFELFGDEPRFLSLPPAGWRMAAKAASWRFPAVGRRIELLAFGQRQDAKALPAMGFEPPLFGPDAYRRLAERTRAHIQHSGC